jgi:Family of unknown function (DUF6600)
MFRRSLVLSLSAVTLFSLALTVPALSASNVRMVRLSLVEGGVQIERVAGQAYEKALLNLPIVQGMSLRTQDGRAEVEFEDGSTVRVGPGTQLAFKELSRRESGAAVSAFVLLSGTAYVNCKGSRYADSDKARSGAKEDDFSFLVGTRLLRPGPKAHFRLKLDKGKAEIAVFDGQVGVDEPSGTVEVSKKQSLTVDLANDQYALAKKVTQDPLDAWDMEQQQYHDRYLAASSEVNSPYSYGVSDLGYYGGFFNAPGYGLVWQPYFVGAGWDPFMYGAWVGDPCSANWALDPSCGSMWVSGYPWGWLPYHYGSWIYLSNVGWAWQPGGFSTWRPITPVFHTPQNFSPPRPPAGLGQNPVMVDRRPAVIRTGFERPTTDKLMVRNGSAGMGIPRGAVRNPQKISEQMERRGEATVFVRPVIPASVARERASALNGQGRGTQAPQQASRASSPPPSATSTSSAGRVSTPPSGNSGGFSRPSGGGFSAPAGSPRR